MITRTELYELCGGEDYEKLANMLQLENNELVLIDPRNSTFNKENYETAFTISKSENATPSNFNNKDIKFETEENEPKE